LAIIYQDRNLLVIGRDQQARQCGVGQSDKAYFVSARRRKRRVREWQIIVPAFDEGAIAIAKMNRYCGTAAAAALSRDVNDSIAIKIGCNHTVDIVSSYQIIRRTAVGECAVSVIQKDGEGLAIE